MHAIRLCSLMLLALVFASTSLPGQSTRIMTYNIRLDVASDGEHAWPRRKAAVGTFISLLNPDLLGLQEAMPHQVAYLDSVLQHHSVYSQPRDGEAGGEACSIFWRKADYTLDTAGTFWLSPTPDTPSFGWQSCCRRICSWVKLQPDEAGRPILVFNAHLDHQYQAARQNGIRIILEHLERINTEGLEVVLLGDFNAAPDTKEISQLRPTMRDAYEEVDPKHRIGPVGTFSGFGLQSELPQYRIDYIWLSDKPGQQSGNRRFNRVKRYASLSAIAAAGYTSDHYAVLVDVE